jgi:signal transduction histidine kinase
LGDPAITHKTDQRQPNEAAQLLSATLSELRDISAGLILPQLEGLSAEETLWLAVKQHEDATGTTVWCEIGELPLCSEPVRVCLYRVVQEGLNNAYQHANALQQRVIVSADSHAITAVVSDGGPSGITPRSRRAGGGLGLIGLKRRVQAFHGTFAVHSQSDETRVTAKIPIAIASSAKI